MEPWLEGVRPGLGKYHAHLTGFGVEHVEDLLVLDEDILAQMQVTLRGAGIPQLQVMIVVKTIKELVVATAGEPHAREATRAREPTPDSSDDSASDDSSGDNLEEDDDNEEDSAGPEVRPEEPEVLMLGPAKHDLLGTGMIIAIHDTRITMEGRADVLFDEGNAGKVLFEFIARSDKQKRTKQRWVFADACASVNAEPEEATPLTPGVFDEMAQAATTDNAFTHGLDSVALAHHERSRKRQRLKDAPVRGRQRSARKTPEPTMSVDKRLEDSMYDGTGLCKQGNQLWCEPCHKVISMRKGTIDKHISSPSHRKAHQTWMAQLGDDSLIK